MGIRCQVETYALGKGRANHRIRRDKVLDLSRALTLTPGRNLCEGQLSIFLFEQCDIESVCWIKSLRGQRECFPEFHGLGETDFCNLRGIACHVSSRIHEMQVFRHF